MLFSSIGETGVLLLSLVSGVGISAGAKGSSALAHGGGLRDVPSGYSEGLSDAPGNLSGSSFYSEILF